MFVTPAQAHEAIEHTIFDHQSPVLAQVGGGSDLLMSILPFILIFVIMYFLILRPQRRQMKAREEMLGNIRRNDTVVTGGGIVGKVTKVVDDNLLEVENCSRHKNPAQCVAWLLMCRSKAKLQQKAQPLEEKK